MKREAQLIAAVTTLAKQIDLSVEDVVIAHPVGLEEDVGTSATIAMIGRAMEDQSMTPLLYSLVTELTLFK